MTVRSVIARLERAEKRVPRKAIPLYITAHWSDKKELWTAKILGHKNLSAAKLKPLRRKIKRKYGSNVLLIILDKPRPLPELDGDGIPIELQNLVKGKEDDGKNKPEFNFL